jgi:hypothetical protein
MGAADGAGVSAKQQTAANAAMETLARRERNMMGEDLK